MSRTVLHSDLNNFYASVEILRHPELKDAPVIVCGNKQDRHGIVLAKNMIAKNFGIKTGDVYWAAKKKCPDAVEIPADFSAYLKVSKQVRSIYEKYTDRVEAFGIDECWLDVTESQSLFGGGEAIAEKIRSEVKESIGITVSIGVSWNKIFAKLGSDMKKPDAVTVITVENFKQKVWPLPIEELLYVGKATKKKLNERNVFTIGEIVSAGEELLKSWLGKWGEYLYAFANGSDSTPVLKKAEEQNIKSIGNSLTNYKDLYDDEDVYMLMLLLSDSVSARLRESAFGKAKTVCLSVTDSSLQSFSGQSKLAFPSRASVDIAECAFNIYKKIFPRSFGVRAVAVTVKDFADLTEQMNIFSDILAEQKEERLEAAIDALKARYGNNIIQRATILKDKRLSELDIKGEHIIHPENFFGR